MNRVKEIFESLSLEQKVGQLIISRGFFKNSTVEMFKEGLLGGVSSVFFREVCGLDNYKIIKLSNEIIESSLISPFFYTDCENGIPHMFNMGTEFPYNMALGATNDTNLSFEMGKAIAKEAKMLRYDIIAGPVLDINDNPDNPIIGTRAFGDTVDEVVSHGLAFFKGIQSQNIISCGKHFPGHGSTAVDTHADVAVIDKCLKTLKRNDFVPFKTAINDGIKAIMSSHIYFSQLENEKMLPATFSKKIIRNLLRRLWGFEGLILTDSLSMKSICKNYSVEEAAVRSIKSGHDLILQDYNSEPEVTFNALLYAVKSGEISKKELDEKVLRILNAKEWTGAFDKKTIPMETIIEINNIKEHQDLSYEIAKKAVTVLENKNIPLDPDAETLIISTKTKEEIETLQDWAMIVHPKTMVLYDYVRRFNENTAVTCISEKPSEEEQEKILRLCQKFQHIIVTNFVRIVSYKEGGGKLPKEQIDFIKKLANQNKNVTNIIYGNPYSLMELPKTQNTMLTYSDSNYSIKATAEIMFGTEVPTGKLPVKVSRKYVRGYGLDIN